MPINFLENACKTSSSEQSFGLCDDPPPATNAAYINENDPGKWIATVNNPRKINADFYAVDHCVTVKRLNGTDESRCDGILLHDTNIIFVELKDRGHKGWLGKGRGQLTTTYGGFTSNHDITAYTAVEAIVANKQRPLANAAHTKEIQQFKDDTGLTLRVQSSINI